MINILTTVKDKIYSSLYSVKTDGTMFVSDIFFSIGNQPSMHRYIAVCCLAVENCFNLNNCGLKMYGKMLCGDNPDKASKTAQEFEAFVKNGYDKNAEVVLDSSLLLNSGAKQLAFAIHLGKEKVKTTHISHPDSCLAFNEDFFTADELAVIEEKSKLLKEKLNRPFTCIIWSPAFPFYKEILTDFGCYGKVSNVKKYSYNRHAFKDTVRRIYAVDNIAAWKIDTKLKYFSKHEDAFIVFDLLLENPDFLPNAAGNAPVSRLCTNAKRDVRAKHKDKIKDYIYDIILHSCDNFYQSQYMQDIFTQCKNCKEIFLQQNI